EAVPEEAVTSGKSTTYVASEKWSGPVQQVSKVCTFTHSFTAFAPHFLSASLKNRILESSADHYFPNFIQQEMPASQRKPSTNIGGTRVAYGSDEMAQAKLSK